MNQQEIANLIERQRTFFKTGKTKDIQFRINALKTLKAAIIKNEGAIQEALKKDLGKSAFESYESEIGVVLKELNFHISGIQKWTKAQRVKTPLVLFPSKSKIYSEPYGNVLIMAPWNYPFLLLIQPLIGAISAGNTILLKTSPYVPEYEKTIERIISETFPADYISLLSGGREVNQLLFQQKFDYLFFTGSPSLGKLAMKAAAENLCPVTLELGGKSPCIVSLNANLKLAARRIIWGKFLNAGQTCIAPDYLLVDQSIEKELIANLKKELNIQIGNHPENNPDFPRIVNEKAFDRLSEYINDGEIVCGGEKKRDEKYIAPTILRNVSPESAVMQNEIFGPILPIITYSQLDEAIDFITSKAKPLAMYIFSNNKKETTKIINSTSAGGGCINDTIIHIANSNMPFGGVGNSGMGKYHGKKSFDTFSNKRAIASTPTWIDLPIKYAPYTNWKMKIIKLLLR